MQANRLHSALILMLAVLLLSSACQRSPRKETTRIGIVPVTHVAVGQSAQMGAYREYHEVSGDIDAAYASTVNDLPRESIRARWSVSDDSLATIGEDGSFVALKPGSVKVKGTWESYEAEATVKVLENLPVAYLPQVTVSGMNCQPQSIALSLDSDRALSFRLGFNDNQCRAVVIEAPAPDAQLPWKFDFDGGALELTKAHGPIISGEARVGGGLVSFTAWADGEGTFPISLANKTVLLTGDSMSEGIGWSFKEKVEAAGGQLIVQPWYSSTTVGWQAERRLTEYIKRYHPDVVFIALGSNEIFTTDLQTRAKAVRGITAELGELPAYWIGPPSWKPDQGIVHTIEENFRPGRFYNSNDLVVPRRRDGAHPTVEGYVTWTELIWKWWARTV